MRWDRRLSVVAIVTLLVLSMALVAVGLSHPSTPTTAEPTRVAGIPSATLHSPATLRSPPAGYAQKLAREFAASGAPADSFLPPNARFAPGYHNGVLVHPSYTEGPEPVGVADYGVRNTSGTATAYTIDSTGYMGSLTLSQDSEFSLPGTGYPELMTVQLNAVLNDTTVNGISGYQFWTQNVLIYDAYAHTGLILDNLWNFSAYPQGPLTSSDILSGNGTVVPSVGFYYDFGSPLLQLPTPFTVQLYLTTSTVSIGGVAHTEVAYAYNITNPTTHTKLAGRTYDNVEFNNQGSAAIPQAKYHVDGSNITGTGYIPFDAELIVGGSTGGSTGSFNDFNGTMTLQHLNRSGRYVNEPATWNAGSETGETVVGLASYYTANDVVHIGPGPSLSQPFWNASPTAAPGAAVISGTVSPSNAFAFVTLPGITQTPNATWAPVPPSGHFTWNLTGGTYVTSFLASEYDPLNWVTTTVASGGIAAPIAATLTANTARGVYTPLYAWDNAQLAAISSGGSGTISSPYILDNNEVGALSAEFGSVNDYFYPEFTGIQLYGTTAYVEIVDPAPFLVDYQGSQLQAANYFGLPSANYLGIELFNTTHVSVVSGTLQGWVGAYQSQYYDDTAYSALVVWNSTSTLVTGVTFQDQGYGITLYGGGNNTITGNYFVNDPVSINAGYGTPFIGYGADGGGPIGIVIYEGGDLIFNNEFTTLYTAVEINENSYDGLYNTYLENFLDNWNLSTTHPATSTFTYNGITVSGSVNGSATVCGNFWWNEVPGAPLPYNDRGYIVNGGDNCPGGPTLFAVPFVESGLPPGTPWGVQAVALPPTTLPYGGTSTVTSSSTFIAVPAEVIFEAVFAPVNGYTDAPSFTEFYLTNGGVLETPSGPATDIAVVYTPLSGATGTLAFTQTGLPAGTSWSVTVGTSQWSSTTGGVANTLSPGSYPYTVGTVPGYAATPPSGQATVSTSAVTSVAISFTPTTGWIAGTVTPPNASVRVDGTAVTISGGTFNVSVPGGIHSVEVTASGYAPYYNNVTVTGGKTTHLTIVAATLSPQITNGLSRTDLYAIVGATLVLALAIILAAAWRRTRDRRQPPAQSWSAPPGLPPSNPPPSGP